MSATNQTTPYGLPQYIEDDQPDMPDFNGAFKAINDALVSMQGVKILGYYPTLSDLQTTVPSPQLGDLYGVGIDPDVYAYVWTGTQWAQGQKLSAASGVLSVNDIAPDEAGNVALTAGDVGAVPTTRTINGKALSEDITLTAVDVGARNRNLADNPFFTVNQAGNSGVYSTAGGYPVDRWKLTSGTVTINADKTLTLNGTLVQIREESLGVEFVTDVFCTSGTATISYNDTTKTITITSSGGTIKAAILEEGTVSTLKNPDGSLRHSPPNPQQELAKCQRYQYRNSIVASEFVRAAHLNANAIYFDVPTPVTMRAHPAIEVFGIMEIRAFNGLAQSGFTFSAIALNGSIRVITEKTAHGLTDATLNIVGVLFNANL